MKKNYLKRALLVGAGLVILSIAVLTSFAETTVVSGCPEDTGGYMSTGIRSKKECTQKIQEQGYWWYIDGEVKWVGTIIAGVEGRFEESVRTITYVGQEYTCVGMDKKCWVCNCYFNAPVVSVTKL